MRNKMYLLPNEKQYKANLHTHSTLSDGKLTVEELKAAYTANGYQIMAFTDHELCVDHQDLCDENFLAITAYEIATTDMNDPDRRTYHMNLFAKDPHNTKQVFFHPGQLGSRRQHQLEMIKCDGYREREYSVECMNEVIRAANEAGYLVSYNHPAWSLQNYTDYIGLKGLWGVEVANGVCLCMGHEDFQPHVFDDLLKAGNRIFPIGADDIHKPQNAFIAFVKVASPSLSYGDVMNALEKGDFYASTGPDIHSLTLENGILSIKCSDAVQVRVCTHNRRRYVTDCVSNEGLVSAVDFDITQWYADSEGRDNAFFRVVVTDERGHAAYSRAYFRDEVTEAFSSVQTGNE
ncbi:MAG: hypothetical protein IKV54_04785 [Clostridia bacterium]|nr:hypothetical protein [Clostridia bacterium]